MFSCFVFLCVFTLLQTGAPVLNWHHLSEQAVPFLVSSGFFSLSPTLLWSVLQRNYCTVAMEIEPETHTSFKLYITLGVLQKKNFMGLSHSVFCNWGHATFILMVIPLCLVPDWCVRNVKKARKCMFSNISCVCVPDSSEKQGTGKH